VLNARIKVVILSREKNKDEIDVLHVSEELDGPRNLGDSVCPLLLVSMNRKKLVCRLCALR
jgi:hypothetical protein